MRSFKVVTRSNGGPPVILTIRADDFIALSEGLIAFRKIGPSVSKTGVQSVAAFHLAPGDYVVEEETGK